ncbi:PWWP domain-containing protein 2A [Anoplophora glabripennis]|nr:PWWP domain-containing protein 2A [Anoplophora glabripennis]
MAEQDSSKDIKLLKRTRISVFVDEALPDILVVTFEFGVKIFKGVLLDSTKRNLPCGVPNVNPAFNVPTKNPDDDTLYSVNQRFAYTDPTNSKKKNVQMPSKYKNNKMTVRLRPRQVLCSKCKGICNENSENVSRKRKSSENVQSSSPPPPPRRSGNAPVTRSVNIHLNNKRTLRGNSTLETRLTRLNYQEENSVDKSNLDSNSNKRPLGSTQQENSQETDKNHSSEHSSDSCNTDDAEAPPLKIVKRILRKKRSVSSAEEQWEEAGYQEDLNRNSNIGVQSSTGTMDPPPNPNSISTTSTRTIKISYGPQGEGTVLKIPAQIDSIKDDDSEENVNVEQQGNKIKEPDNKAARRALKKAKKEARRKVLLSGSSPLYLGGASPRYMIGGSSPRYTVGSASPRHGLGNNSPRYMCTYELNVPRRRKHKMKHKKKHREDKDRRHKEGEVSSTQDDSKEQCITQKLSINLKRLNNTYTSSTTSDKIDDNMSSSDEHNEQFPNFPPPNPPLMLRINAQTVSSAMGADGVRLLVGDVVWGKIHGFPWWPGKILTITSCGAQGPQAHVAWYGSSTSSLMQCDQLSHYLDNFKTRYNKKKKGPYKEAIKQATTEARENAENRVRQPLGNSPSHNIIQVVPPALASPREIDVVS